MQILGMKTTVAKLKNATESPNSGLTQAKESVSLKLCK
jgi:hypothetical protein